MKVCRAFVPKLESFFLSFLLLGFCYSQDQNAFCIKFHFDKWQKTDSLNEKAKIIGVSLVEDRFGNQNSACYFNGNIHSYVNLGTGKSLKPEIGSVSLWFRCDEIVYSGTGYSHNVILLTKSHSGDDFFEGYSIDYDYRGKRIIGSVTESEEKQISIRSIDTLHLGKWYHVVITFDDNFFQLFVNGELQNKLQKRFTNKYLESDSVMLGNSANLKNLRFFNGCIDDIEIYHKVLSNDEVIELYNSPNPNRNAIWYRLMFWLFGIVVFLILIYLAIKRRIKIYLKRENEKHQLSYDLMEQKIKVLRSQMNPHFIFNSLNTIQQFIITNNNGLAELYLSKFSKLLRSTLEINNREFVTLSEEIEYIKRYVEIESLRFGSRIELTVKIDSRIKEGEVRIPQMMIQPFVENSIWHGLPQRAGFKRINLFFDFISDKKVGCIVDDNGTGIKLEKDEALKKKKSFAIELIQQRLSLLGKLNKENYAFSVLSKFDEIGNSEGVRIEIEIPIIKSDT